MKSLLISLTLAATLSHVPPPARAASAPDSETAGAKRQSPPQAGAAHTARWQTPAPPTRFTETGGMLLVGLGFMATVTVRRSRKRATT